MESQHFSILSPVNTAQIDTASCSLTDELDSLRNAIVAIDAYLGSPTLAMEQSNEDEK
jgi:hypothetical protein